MAGWDELSMWESMKFWWGEQGGEVLLALCSLKSGNALYHS